MRRNIVDACHDSHLKLENYEVSVGSVTVSKEPSTIGS